jgi:hypothetical protein
VIVALVAVMPPAVTALIDGGVVSPTVEKPVVWVKVADMPWFARSSTPEVPPTTWIL